MADVIHVTLDEFNKFEKRIDNEIRNNREDINFNRNSITKLETLYNTLSKLPSAIESLEKTVVSVNMSLESMNTRIGGIQETISRQRDSINRLKEDNQKQDEYMESIDSKSKIDWAVFITKNFWAIIASCGFIYFLFRNFLENF